LVLYGEIRNVVTSKVLKLEIYSITYPGYLFVTQGFDGVHLGSLIGRVYSEKESHAAGEKKG